MGCIGDETTETLLGGGALVERLLDLTQHRVQRPAQPADLGAGVVVVDALGEITAGDRGCGHLDSAEGAQAHANEPEAEEKRREQHGRRDDDLDEEELMERVVGIVERRRNEEQLALRAGLPDCEPELRVAVDGRHRERPAARPDRARTFQGEVGLREGRLTLAGPDGSPADITISVDQPDVDPRIRGSERVESAWAEAAALECPRGRNGAAIDPVDEK